MKVSVIVPIYNVENYLKECLDSIISQTYENLEIILVDDGSTDNCFSICKEYEKIDKRIQLIHKDNGGLSDARNAGISKATGDYLCFIDSDDYIHKKMIETLVNNAVAKKADISVCGYKKIGIRQELNKTIEKQLVWEKEELLESIYQPLSVNIIVAWAKIYNKRLFENVKYEKGKIHEDEIIVHELLYHANRMVYTPEQYYYYRINPSSITGVKFKENRLDIIYALENRLEFCKRKNLERIYQLTLNQYCNKVTYLWYLMKKNLPDNIDKIKELRNKFINNYKKVLYSKEIKNNKKVILLLERFIPSLYCGIKLYYRKKRKGTI